MSILLGMFVVNTTVCNVYIVRYVCCEILLFVMSIVLGMFVVKYYCM